MAIRQPKPLKKCWCKQVEEAAKETGVSMDDVTKMVKAVYGIE
nr:hypothetical protein [Avibacterium paragallinarum]